VGAIIDAGAVPIHGDVARMKDGRGGLEHALHDGEDHELLFTAAGEVKHDEVKLIGRVMGEREILLNREGRIEKLEAKGWEHLL